MTTGAPAPSPAPSDMPAPAKNRAMILRKRPIKEITADVVELQELPPPRLEDRRGEPCALVHTLYASIDPTHRIWMGDGDQYWEPAELGKPMRAITLGVVLESTDPALPVGAHVVGTGGLQDLYLTSAREGASVVEPVADLPITAHLSVLSMIIGLTAWVGVEELTQPKSGETFVVSGGAGAVGSLAGQLAKNRGARVIGIVGSAEKARWLTEDLGFDAAINYKQGEDKVVAALREAAPEGVDAYFDNTGGVSTEAVLRVANNSLRVAVCGVISGYNSGELGLRSYDMILHRRVSMRGFVCLDWLHKMPHAVKDIASLLQEGKVHFKEDVQEGLENYVPALNRLFNGTNTGKLILKL